LGRCQAMATKDALDRFTLRARIRPLSRDPSKPRLGAECPLALPD
jgi:hypothetical protein